MATELHETARHSSPRKNLAADESTGTITKGRLDQGHQPKRTAPTATSSSTPGAEEYISGVIPTTRRFARARWTSAVPEAARVEGNHPRHQGRRGREVAAHAEGETITEGLMGFAPGSRYYGLGALREVARDVLDHRFAPSEYCI
jgi:hypothetical protein